MFDIPISIPLEAVPTDFLRVHNAEDLTVLSSHALEDKWNWFLEYTTTNEKGAKLYFKTYFKRVGTSLYIIDLSSVSASKPSELQNVVDSFKVTRELPSKGVEYVVYENPDYGYKIEYPQDWGLIDTSTERTILFKGWRSISGVITIHIVPSDKPIDAALYAKYLADITTDEWRDLEVTYSHSLSGKWDWVLGFTFTDIIDIEGIGPIDKHGEAYITQTPEYAIVVRWDAEEGLIETCKKIVDSFVIPETPASPTTPTLSLKIVSVTSPVSPGANATLVAETILGAECDITVYYKSGPSTASGLYPKTADINGRVSWTWKVGTQTTPGSWQIVVEASYGGKTISQTEVGWI